MRVGQKFTSGKAKITPGLDGLEAYDFSKQNFYPE